MLHTLWTFVCKIIERTRVSIFSSLLMLHILWSCLFFHIKWIEVVLRPAWLNRCVILKSSKFFTIPCYTVVRFVPKVLYTLLVFILVLFCLCIEPCKIGLPF